MANTGCFDAVWFDSDKEKLPTVVDATEYLINGELRKWSGKTSIVYSPIIDRKTGKRIEIGVIGDLTEKEAIEAVDAAYKAYHNGRGEWPSMPTKERIERVEAFLKEFVKRRDEIVQFLMWEICKNLSASEKEVDRTVKYIQDTISELKNLENKQNIPISDTGTSAIIKRVPLGVCLSVAPANYPINECYTTLIPALLMGNTCVLKIPRTGCLCHYPTLQLFQKFFPKGAVNVVTGSGRLLLPAMMKHEGKIDILAFIGTHKAAQQLQMSHPAVHRLRVVLGLDAKNSAVILPDANINEIAIPECLLGTLSFNGQRCTAIKIIWVHESIADEFVKKFSEAVDKLKIGLPWEKGVQITPLEEPEKPKYIADVVEDALQKGSHIVNKGGHRCHDQSLVFPTVLYPVSKGMRVFEEEQFGPVVPIAKFKDIEEYYTYLDDCMFGQQASVFSTGKDQKLLASVIDVLANQVSRINLNSQCERGPDSFPFNGRKNSAFNTLSVFDALKSMSIRTIVATKETEKNLDLVSELLTSRKSRFFRSTYLT